MIKSRSADTLWGNNIEESAKETIAARWLKLKDAAFYSSIGQHKLKQLASLRVVRGFKDPDSVRGDWIFDRVSLDTYRMRQFGNEPTAREKALAILQGVRV